MRTIRLVRLVSEPYLDETDKTAYKRIEHFFREFSENDRDRKKDLRLLGFHLLTDAYYRHVCNAANFGAALYAVYSRSLAPLLAIPFSEIARKLARKWNENYKTDVLDMQAAQFRKDHIYRRK